MNILNLIHIPKQWHCIMSLFFTIINPIILTILSFLTILLPIQSFFPAQATPDVPIIILFCLLLHKYARYFVPVFFVCVLLYEYCLMMPAGSLIIHYGLFAMIGYFSWAKRLENDVSFRLLYFFFYMAYLLTLIFDIIIYSFMLEGYLGFYDAFLFWISNIIIFPVIFYCTYYLILHSRQTESRTDTL